MLPRPGLKSRTRWWKASALLLFQLCGGGQEGWETRRKGQEEYRRWEKRGKEAGFPRWWKPEKKGKIMQQCATFCNQKNAKRQEPTNTSGIKGYGKREV